MATPLPAPLADQLERGIRAVTLEDIRWARCDIKAISLLANVLLRQQALDAGADEAILLRDGCVTEGAASNVFAVLEDVIVTPPKGPALLPGITRDLVLELLVAEDVSYREAHISERELCAASEIWVTSSSKEVLPVTVLNGVEVADRRPGPQWRQMRRLFENYKARLRAGEVR